jgi:dTDP-4-dehydrorhamnose reductase
MRVFVTGGNGQLGRALARVFSDAELYLGCHETENITSPAIVQTIVDFRPNIVIHAAAMTDVDACEINPGEAFLVNEQGTRYVAEGANRASAVMVYLSTDYVFDGKKEKPYIETDRANPISIYGRSKLAGEGIIQELADRWLIVRTSWVYGEGRQNFVANLLEWVKTPSALRLVGDCVGSPTYTLDLANAIFGLVNQGAIDRVFHVSGEGACNWVLYGQEILRIAGIEKEIIPIRFEELRRPAKRPSYSVLSNATINQEGFTMRPWPIALREFMKNRQMKSA